jgi:hypothetical protein
MALTAACVCVTARRARKVALPPPGPPRAGGVTIQSEDEDNEDDEVEGHEGGSSSARVHERHQVRLKRLVVESPWSPFTGECQRF